MKRRIDLRLGNGVAAASALGARGAWFRGAFNGVHHKAFCSLGYLREE